MIISLHSFLLIHSQKLTQPIHNTHSTSKNYLKSEQCVPTLSLSTPAGTPPPHVSKPAAILAPLATVPVRATPHRDRLAAAAVQATVSPTPTPPILNSHRLFRSRN